MDTDFQTQNITKSGSLPYMGMQISPLVYCTYCQQSISTLSDTNLWLVAAGDMQRLKYLQSCNMMEEKLTYGRDHAHASY